MGHSLEDGPAVYFFKLPVKEQSKINEQTTFHNKTCERGYRTA